MNENYGGDFGLGESNVNFVRYFIGKSYFNSLANLDEINLFLANVTFESGCRNNWHIHYTKSDGGQILICVDGEGWFQIERRNAVSLKSGDVIIILANVKHLHGDKGYSWFSHIVIEAPEIGTSTEWCEQVMGEEYDKLDVIKC